MIEQEDQYWEAIDDFLDGTLPEAEKANFEHRLQEEKQLLQDVNFQRSLRHGVAYGSQDDLRERLFRIQTEYQSGGQQEGEGKVVPIGRGLWSRWLVAAGMLIGALTILFLIQSPSSPGELYASNYEPYNLNTTTRSPGQEDLISLAVEAYQGGNYENAIPRLKAALDAEPQQATLQLALAVSLWENGQQEATMQELQPILDHPLLADQANWFAALFLLETGNTDEARTHLEIVQQTEGALGKRAEQLLKELNQ